jgi:membrane protein required for beta-lactamase induction
VVVTKALLLAILAAVLLFGTGDIYLRTEANRTAAVAAKASQDMAGEAVLANYERAEREDRRNAQGRAGALVISVRPH